MEPPRRKPETTQIPRFSDELPAIQSWREVPSFETGEAEARFWEAHQVDPRLMQMSIHRSDVRESTTITLRFDPRMLSRIKRIARRRYLNYQSMIKQWLSERMEQEMRD
jgi:predicted DNA binding CopG/RHH family protein